MTESIDSVRLNHLLLLEVNYQYECQSREEAQRPPLCLLLLGHVLDGPETYEILRGIAVPLTLHIQRTQDGVFQYDKAQVEKRVRLAREVDSKLQLCGIMVVNDQIYDYKSLVEKFVHDFGPTAKYLFAYEPDLDTEIEQKLNGFRLSPSKSRIGYRLDHGTIPIIKEESHIVAPPSDRRLMEQEATFERRVKAEVDRMIRYLDTFHPSDEVLRKISMLVCHLRRGATKDIEEVIMNKEGEINALRIACEQWEMGIKPWD